MIIVSTWKFLGIGLDLFRLGRAETPERCVGHASLQVTAGPNKGVYISWWPSGEWVAGKGVRYASPNTLKADLANEAEHRRNQMNTQYEAFLNQLEEISKGGGTEAEHAREMWEAVMLGDTEEKKRLKFRPPSETWRIPSQADGELFGLDDLAIVRFWNYTLNALKKAVKTKTEDKSTYYDLMTSNCSDAIMLAMGAGLGRLDETGNINKDAGWLPRGYPQVPDIRNKLMLFGLALPTITPDTVEAKAAEVMSAIGEMQTAYKNALKKIPTDKKVELLPAPKSAQFDQIDDKLLSANFDKRAVAIVTKALEEYKNPKSGKAKDAAVLAEMLIDVAEYLPATPGKDGKGATVTWEVVYEFANQVHDTIDQLREESAKEIKVELAKSAASLWK